MRRRTVNTLAAPVLREQAKQQLAETVVDEGTQRIKRLGPQRSTKALYKIIDTVFTFLSRCWIEFDIAHSNLKRKL